MDNSNKIKLICISYAGGSAQEYKIWGSIICENIEIIPVVLPGHGKRLKEKLLKSIDSMVVEAYGQIKSYLNEEYAILGHSMGAIIAHELTNKITEKGLPSPKCLFLSGRQAPHLPTKIKKIYNSPEEKLKDRVLEYGGTPAEIFVNPELKDIFIPIFSADFDAVDKYEEEFKEQSKPVLETDFVVFTGSDDKLTTEQLAGWQQYTKNEISIQCFPGGHFFINDKDNVVQIIKIIENKLING